MHIRIAHIDDNLDDQFILKRRMSKASFSNSIQVFSHSKSLLDQIKSDPYSFDIIISDYKIHGINGYHLMSELKKITDIPFIFLTGTVGDENAARFIRSGAYDFISKSNSENICDIVYQAHTEFKLINVVSSQKKLLDERSYQLNSLLESMTDLVTLKDLEGKFIISNKSYKTFTGITDDELLGKRIDEVPTDRIAGIESQEADNYVLQQAVGMRVESRINIGTETRIYETIKSPMNDSNEIVQGVISVSRDVTEKTLASEQIRKREALLNYSERYGYSGSFELDLSTRLMSCSENLRSILGYICTQEITQFDQFIEKVFCNNLDIVIPHLERGFESFEEMAFNCLIDDFLEAKAFKIFLVPNRLSSDSKKYFGFVQELTSRDDLSEFNLLEDQERERRRISQELHDGLGQKLVALKMFFNSLEVSDGSNSLLHGCRELVDETLSEVRLISKNLANANIEENGLEQSLYRLKDLCGSNFQVDFDLNFDEDVICSEVAHHLYRIVQEVLSNASKYAQCKMFRLSLSIRDTNIYLEMVDDGVGFDSVKTSSGLGLNNIQTRVRICGGICIIKSSKGNGTSYSIKVPNKEIELI